MKPLPGEKPFVGGWPFGWEAIQISSIFIQFVLTFTRKSDRLINRTAFEYYLLRVLRLVLGFGIIVQS